MGLHTRTELLPHRAGPGFVIGVLAPDFAAVFGEVAQEVRIGDPEESLLRSRACLAPGPVKALLNARLA